MGYCVGSKYTNGKGVRGIESGVLDETASSRHCGAKMKASYKNAGTAFERREACADRTDFHGFGVVAGRDLQGLEMLQGALERPVTGVHASKVCVFLHQHCSQAHGRTKMELSLSWFALFEV
jgi:hypothetical protein